MVTIRRERRYGESERQIVLPDYVDGSKAAARIRNGMLKITIPKRPEAERRPLRIETE